MLGPNLDGRARTGCLGDSRGFVQLRWNNDGLCGSLSGLPSVSGERATNASGIQEMFQRWSVRSLQRPSILRQFARPSNRSQLSRSNSSNSNQSRTLPGSNGGFKLRPWQRAFLVGATAGSVAGLALVYFDRKQRNDRFVTYELAAREPVSSTASIFHLKPTRSTQEFGSYKEAWDKGIWNVHFKQPQIQIVRAYTPLPPTKDVEGQDTKELRFLIRHDPHGEVSSYLHRLPIGSEIELRGPNLEYELTPDVQQVVFFAGGTGIAPALQIAHAMFDAPRGTENNSKAPKKLPKLHVLWASRKREDCAGGVSDAPAVELAQSKTSWPGLFSKQKQNQQPTVDTGEEQGLVVQELEDLKKRYPGQITVEYFVNAEGTWIDEDVVFRALSRFDSADFTSGYATPHEQRQILISGPSGFISYLAGPKEWRNGREEQGHVSKIVAHAIAQNPRHVKVWKV